MTDRRFLALSWLLVGLLSAPWLVAAYDWCVSELERRHRPLWGWPGMLDQEQERLR